MKALNLIVVITLIFILSSCGNRTPIIGSEYPFIVYKITSYNSTHSIYTSNNWESGAYYPGAELPEIILPSGAYNIGDTIRFTSFH